MALDDGVKPARPRSQALGSALPTDRDLQSLAGRTDGSAGQTLQLRFQLLQKCAAECSFDPGLESMEFLV
jgi:hypothetical protein